VSFGGETIGYRIGDQGFREKPDLELAREFVAQGYLWNAGIFLFKASTMLDELQLHAPETLAAVAGAMDRADRRMHWHRQLVAPERDSFETAPLDLAIDVAVMEKTDRAVVVPCEAIGWSDVGSLSALWEIADKDAAGNAVKGDVLLHETSNVFVHSTSSRKVVVGHVEDLLVVDTEDALIVLPTAEAQSVKTIVKDLKRIGAPQLRYQREATFSWGSVHLDAADAHHLGMSLHLVHGGELRHTVVSPFETWIVTGGTVAAEIDHRVMLVPAGNTFTLGKDQSLTLTAIEEDARLALVAAPTTNVNLDLLFADPPSVTVDPSSNSGEPLSEVA
jgi:mannose-1-phosphate guanylyltransferase